MSRTLSALARARWQLTGVAVFTVISLGLTLLVAGTLARGGTGEVRMLQARFHDATGLHPGNDIRIAGVRVGKVESLRLDGKVALVRFSVQADQPVYAATVASIDYLNLMGQRYIALTTGPRPGPELEPGATIPLERTRDGLDLTALFNAFKPLFELIRPDDVNRLATNIVQVLQGEGPTLRHLMAQTAQLTAHLGDRDRVIEAVITNLTTVMETVHGHRGEIASMVRQLDGLTASIAGNRTEIGATIDGVQGLVTTFAGLLRDGGSSLDRDVASLAAWAHSFARRAPRLAEALRSTQLLLRSYVKTLGLGSYLNTYVCQSSLQLGDGGQTVELRPSRQNSERCR